MTRTLKLKPAPEIRRHNLVTRVMVFTLFIAAFFSIIHAPAVLGFFSYDGMIACSKAKGDIVFVADGVECLRLCQDGDFKIYGRTAKSDDELHAAFRAWLIENKGHLRVVK